jgi:hypothetical protein
LIGAGQRPELCDRFQERRRGLCLREHLEDELRDGELRGVGVERGPEPVTGTELFGHGHTGEAQMGLADLLQRQGRHGMSRGPTPVLLQEHGVGELPARMDKGSLSERGQFLVRRNRS